VNFNKDSSDSFCPCLVCHNQLSLLIISFIFLLFLLSSCSDQKTPESIADEFIDRCEETIEKRQLRKLRHLISDDYHDAQGRNKQDIAAIGGGYVLRNKKIHIYSRLASAASNGDQIEATILTAIAGSPINNTSMLPSLNADMYWFEVKLVEEDGDWLIADASWRQAMLDDFIEN